MWVLVQLIQPLRFMLRSPTTLKDVPMQQWDPSTAGYNLTLSNYNGEHGIDYRFTQLHNGSPISVLAFQGVNVGRNNIP